MHIPFSLAQSAHIIASVRTSTRTCSLALPSILPWPCLAFHFALPYFPFPCSLLPIVVPATVLILSPCSHALSSFPYAHLNGNFPFCHQL